jgi:hypothetical protein
MEWALDASFKGRNKKKKVIHAVIKDKKTQEEKLIAVLLHHTVPKCLSS